MIDKFNKRIIKLKTKFNKKIISKRIQSSLPKWTFGIATHGNNQNLLKVILSIEALKIPRDKFEIILAVDERNDNIKYHQIIIPEKFRIKNLIWPEKLSKKKNDIIKEAKFENICLLHDYIAFDIDWYKAYIEFKENWKICGNQVRNLNVRGNRIADWIGWTPKGLSLLPYNSHVDNMFMSGMYFCVKKSFIINNNLFLCEESCKNWEDQEWSARCLKHTKFSFNKNAINYSIKHKQFGLHEIQ